MNANFEKLAMRNGGYSLPYLIYLHDFENNIEMRFVNSNDSVTFNGNTYTAASFKYTPNASDNGFDGGGKLEISIKDNSIVELLDGYRNFKLEVVGVIDEQGTITELKAYSHTYGKATATRTTATFTFDKDDRLSMTFPTLLWSNQNNRGNS